MDDKQVDRLCLVLDDINNSLARIATVLERTLSKSEELIPFTEILEDIKVLRAAKRNHEYGDNDE